VEAFFQKMIESGNQKKETVSDEDPYLAVDHTGDRFKGFQSSLENRE
jgi:hypothetical protein